MIDTKKCYGLLAVVLESSLSPFRSTISRGCIISAETSHIATNGPVFSVGQIMVTTGKWDRS